MSEVNPISDMLSTSFHGNYYLFHAVGEAVGIIGFLHKLLDFLTDFTFCLPRIGADHR